MFASSNQFGTTLFASSPTETFVALVPCPCNSFVISPTGGLVFSGSAQITDTIISGGMVFGGSAFADLLGTFDSVSAIYLLDGLYDGSTDQVLDFSINGLNGTAGNPDGSSVPSQVPGVYCRDGQSFNGSDFISLPQDPIRTTQDFSVSLWTSISDQYKGRTLFSRGYHTSSASWVFSCGYDFLRHPFAQVQVLDPDNNLITEFCQGSTQMMQDQTYFLAYNYIPGNSLSIYLNGTLDATKLITETQTAPYTSGNYIGRLNTSSLPNSIIQDVRLYPQAHDATWWLASYQNICDPSFMTIVNE